MPSLRPRLGVAGLTFYGVGMIVGAGVYSVVGAAAGHAGSALWMSFALGAVVALLTGLSYAELSTMFPRAGAEYAYAAAAFPKLRVLAFVLGVVLTLAAAGTAATVSLAFAGYLSVWVSLPKVLVALALIVVLTTVNLLHVGVSSRVNVVFTLLEVGGLVAFIAVGAARGDLGAGLREGPGPGVLAGAALLFFAYLGFEDIVNMAEESERPARDLPRAILTSVGVTTVLYVGVGFAAVALLPPAEAAASESPLSTAAAKGSPLVADALAIVALFATSNTALIAMLAGSRLLFGMGRDGDAPKFLGTVGKRFGSPWVATLVLAAVAAALVPWGSVAAVAGLSSFAALSAFVMVNVCLLVLRYRAPGMKRPFKVPLSVAGFPVLPALALASAGLLLLHFEWQSYLAGGIAVLLALLLHVARPRGRRETRSR